MPSFVNINGRKEDLKSVNHIYVVDIKEFVCKYENIAVRQKMNLVKVILEKFFTKERKLPPM